MARAATVTQGAGLSGLEFGLAIPGTVGGAVWANAGAHESDVRAILESALVMGADGREVRLDVDGLGLGYRDSRLKHRADPAAAARGRGQRHLPAQPGDPRRDPRAPRRDPALAAGPSAAGHPQRRLVLPQPARRFGRAADRGGRPQGTRLGGASVSEKHANFLVNDRKGTADDVRRLGERVRAEVATRFGVELEPEVVFVGDWGPAWSATASAGRGVG